MKRITIAMLGVVVGLTAGCKDLGLDGNVPLDQAENRSPGPLVEAVMGPSEPLAERLIVNGRLWVPSGLPVAMDPSGLQAVGAAGGRTVYARTWDRTPFDALFVELSGEETTGAAATTDGPRWVELRPVLGRSGPVPDGDGAAGPAGGAPSTDPAHSGH